MHHKCLIFASILLIISSFSSVNTEDSGIGEIDLEQYTTNLINDNLLPTSYNKNIRPNYGRKPVLMNVSIMINDISSISETAMEYKVDFYIRHFWNDHRLSFPVQHNISRLTLGEEFAKKIWLPDTFFENAKDLNIHKTVATSETTLFRISSNGDVVYSTRIALVARCPMDLTYFPLDQQKCSIEIASYGETADEVTYKWKADSSAVEFSSEINLPTFHLVGYNKFETMETISTGTFSRIQLDIFLTRSSGFYISQVYIPACLVVIISWLPFWLDRNDHHARVALGVTTVLTMTTLVTNTNSDFPKISHLKAIDIYLFICFVMVFLSLIEYATVGYYEVKCAATHRKQELAVENENGTNSNQTEIQSKEKYKCEPNPRLSDQQKRMLIKDTSIIDYCARRMFPISFVIFNVVYMVTLCFLVSFNSSHTEIDVRL